MEVNGGRLLNDNVLAAFTVAAALIMSFGFDALPAAHYLAACCLLPVVAKAARPLKLLQALILGGQQLLLNSRRARILPCRMSARQIDTDCGIGGTPCGRMRNACN